MDPLFYRFNKIHDQYPNSNKIYLGKFIEYIGVPYVTDWLPQGKARFENGIISQGYYDKIIPDPYKI